MFIAECRLRPCPFCGGRPKIAEARVVGTQSGGSFGKGFRDWILRIECDCGITLEKEHQEDMKGNPLSETAFDVWNRRVMPGHPDLK